MGVGVVERPPMARQLVALGEVLWRQVLVAE